MVTDHPVLIDLLNSVLGFNDDTLCDLIVPIGEWEYDKAIKAWGCSGLFDGQVSFEGQVSQTQNKFMISGQTKWVFPSKFLEALKERFHVGGFTTHVRCEWVEDSEGRCPVTFANFSEADADHIVRWNDGGPTTVENGRLLCQKHNRAPRPGEGAPGS